MKVFGIPSTKINVVYNFVDTSFNYSDLLPGEQIVSISTIEPGKNYEKMIPQLHKQTEDLKTNFFSCGNLLNNIS